MTGLILFGSATVTIVVLGAYFAQAIAIALLAAAHAARCALNLLVWLGWFVVQPQRALESLRDGIAAAEAESAIRRLNAPGGTHA